MSKLLILYKLDSNLYRSTIEVRSKAFLVRGRFPEMIWLNHLRYCVFL